MAWLRVHGPKELPNGLCTASVCHASCEGAFKQEKEKEGRQEGETGRRLVLKGIDGGDTRTRSARSHVTRGYRRSTG